MFIKSNSYPNPCKSFDNERVYKDCKVLDRVGGELEIHLDFLNARSRSMEGGAFLPLTLLRGIIITPSVLSRLLPPPPQKWDKQNLYLML